MIKCEVLPGHIISHKNRNYKVGEIIELENTEAQRLKNYGCIKILSTQSQNDGVQSQEKEIQSQNDDTQSQKVSTSKKGKGKVKNED